MHRSRCFITLRLLFPQGLEVLHGAVQLLDPSKFLLIVEGAQTISKGLGCLQHKPSCILQVLQMGSSGGTACHCVDGYDRIDNIINPLFWVGTDTARRVFLYVDSVVISQE